MPCTRMAIPLRSIAPGEGHVSITGRRMVPTDAGVVSRIFRFLLVFLRGTPPPASTRPMHLSETINCTPVRPRPSSIRMIWLKSSGSWADAWLCSTVIVGSSKRVIHNSTIVPSGGPLHGPIQISERDTTLSRRPPHPRRFTLHDRFCETNPISAEGGRDWGTDKGAKTR